MENAFKQFAIIGESRAMQTLAEQTFIVAPLWDTILITGERGTGKELLAKTIHKLGPTKGKPLTIVDCAALNPSTVESVLFGHERGSFTGAVHRHIGYLEACDGGTLFLDEIGALPLDIQYRLLRFIEEQTVTRIGSVHARKVHTRILAATNRNLEQASVNGHFLPDLYDRLNILPLFMPPLRERESDALLLFSHFMRQNSGHRLTKEAKEYVLNYSYPGNVRELRNLCRRLLAFHPDQPISRKILDSHLSSRTHFLALKEQDSL